MPLIDLKTNLKSLKFGNDQPGGGSSGLPYIQTGIPPDRLILRNPAIQGLRGDFLPIYRPGSTGGSDYPIRGGAIDFSIGTQTFTLSNQIDKIRIKRFFEDKARGTIFIQKQIGLQLSNPKMETGKSLLGFAQSLPLPGLLENTRIYNNGVNTLAQVGVSGTGAHAVRHGTLPFLPWQKNYYAIVNEQNVTNNENINRLVILQKLKMTSNTSRLLGDIVSRESVDNIEVINNLGISLNRNLIYQYLGGPGSTYGIGNTTVKRAVDTTKITTSNTLTYDQLRTWSNNNITDGQATTNIQDFRLGTTAYDPERTWIPEDGVDYRFYTAIGSYKDKMNQLYPFIFENGKEPWALAESKTDDLIKFVFEAISNDDPTNSIAIFFRAFLTAGITDNNSAELNTFKYAGRGENFYTYQGFNRTISFSFRVAAGSKDELIPMYNRLNSLVSQVYPDYSFGQQIMRAPIVRVTIGDYLYRMPGFLESVNITVDNNYTWEVDKTYAQLPHVVDVNVAFKPIFDVLPKRGGAVMIKPGLISDTEVGITDDPTSPNVISDTTIAQNVDSRKGKRKARHEQKKLQRESEKEKRKKIKDNADRNQLQQSSTENLEKNREARVRKEQNARRRDLKPGKDFFNNFNQDIIEPTNIFGSGN